MVRSSLAHLARVTVRSIQARNRLMARSRRIPDVMVKQQKDELRLRRAAVGLSTRLYCLLSEFNSST